jgi:hypothetical protein
VDSEYREPSWRGVILTVVAVVVVLAGLVLLTSFLLQQACDPGTVNCLTPSAPAPGN